MPPKKTAPASKKRGTKRAAPAAEETQPSAKRTSTRAAAAPSAPTQRPTASSRSTANIKLTKPGQLRLRPTYVPKPGMNALPASLAPLSEGKRELFVFGSGDMGQHGLGVDMTDEIKRPRLHAGVRDMNLAGTLGSGGLESLAAGGMHTLSCDSTGRILSWGINDNAALGRQTTRDESTDAEVFETQPMQVEGLAPLGHGPRTGPLPEGGTDGAVEVFRATRVAAGDSISVALSEVGELRIWGGFRSSDGPLGFDTHSSKMTQAAPVALPELAGHSFVDIACGDDHVLALATDGTVFSWGNGLQSQLGRRIIERRKRNGLKPERVAVRNIVHVAAGGYHSFALDKDGEVWGWGLNSFSQLGFQGTGEPVLVPTRIENLSPEELADRFGEEPRVVAIDAGTHHSLFLLSDGRVLGVGRCDASELGLAETDAARKDMQAEYDEWLPVRTLEMHAEQVAVNLKMTSKMLRLILKWGAEDKIPPEELARSWDEMDPVLGPGPEPCARKPALIAFPNAPDGTPTRIASIACGSRHNLAVATHGLAYSWGFGPSCQLGQGSDEDTVETPTVLQSTQLNPYDVVAATAGGQHSALLAVKRKEREEEPVTRRDPVASSSRVRL